MSKSGKVLFLVALGGVVVGAAVAIWLGSVYTKTSKSEYCMSCHYHSDQDDAWKKSVHYNNGSGSKTDCASCHIPPTGSFEHFKVKTITGMKDIFSYITKDKEDIDWESKKELDYAKKIVFNASCKECHVNLFPSGINDDGITAHLYYEENEAKLNLQCINCHLDVGHYDPNYTHAKMVGIPVSSSASSEVFESPAEITSFSNYTETIPGTSVSMRMVAVPGGEFTIGSPESEPGRKADEGPQRRISVSSFFMSEIEVTWDQYWAFYGETMSEGRTAPETVYANNSRPDVDAVTGPTPPFGNPDQGWGMGERPAITMTHYAAETFCQWLSLKTGRTYRLPTEAEWEYAARAGSQEAYPFGGDPKKYSGEGFLKSIFKPDTTVINSYAIYAMNSRNRTAEASNVRANAFGLKNMAGNVMEYCSDRYSEDAYSNLKDGDKDPKGPAEGQEWVVRGGQYSDDAIALRSAARSHTLHDDWLRTDPQNPKSIWWYSDIKGIGFRVVCEVPEGLN